MKCSSISHCGNSTFSLCKIFQQMGVFSLVDRCEVPTLENGVIQGQTGSLYHPGDKLWYNCNDGYVTNAWSRSSSGEITCQGGYFSPKPECIEGKGLVRSFVLVSNQLFTMVRMSLCLSVSEMQKILLMYSLNEKTLFVLTCVCKHMLEIVCVMLLISPIQIQWKYWCCYKVKQNYACPLQSHAPDVQDVMYIMTLLIDENGLYTVEMGTGKVSVKLSVSLGISILKNHVQVSCYWSVL